MKWRWANQVFVVLLFTAACAGSGPSTNAPGVSADGEIDVEALVQFVEEAREREFLIEPEVTLVDQLGAGAPGPWTSRDWDVLRLTGIISADSDRASANSVSSAGISGICCPVRVVRHDDPVITASVAVHELVHLLDDDLDPRPAPPPSLIDVLHIVAIGEGNAARVQDLFLRAHGRNIDAVRDTIEIPPEMPSTLVDLITVSYVSGAELASQIVAEGGELAIDDAYQQIPASAEQVMFPSAYFEDDVPVEVDAPILVEESSPPRSGRLGTFVLGFMVANDRVDVLRQWSGDAYALWETDAQVCLTAEIVMDSADAASALGSAIAEFVPDMRVVADGERVGLERCLPSS